MQVAKMIKMTISAVNGTEKEIQVSDQLTGYQLKEYINLKVCASLNPIDMKLFYAGIKIQNDKKLSYYKIVTTGKMKILQTKVQLDQIPGLIVAYEEDQISFQTKTARMPCGHVIGRDCMTQFIKSLVVAKKYQIICPSYKTNAQRCQMEWEFSMCRKVGVFTQEEILQFQQGLSKNYINSNTIQCPKCLQSLFKGDLKHDRVVCPKCKYGDFCSSCLRKWIADGFDVCGNKDCKTYNQFLNKSPWDYKFELTDENKKIHVIMGPRHRACAYKCGAVIQIVNGCKHMKCKNCKKDFCWVCLSLKQNGKWKCGGSGTYCGKVAQTQTAQSNE